MALSESEELELLKLLEYEEILQKRDESPEKLDILDIALEDPKIRVIVIEGGRGGAKSWTVAKKLLKIANKRPIRLFCGREIQNSIDDSVKQVFLDLINDLSYEKFADKNKQIFHENGSIFKFKGFRGQGSFTSRQNIKGFEGADYMWNDEAQTTSQASIDVLEPTIRRPNSKLIYTLNRLDEEDPVIREHCRTPREDVLHIKINYYDNPFCPQVIIDQAERMKKEDYNRYLHIYEGEPMKQGDDSVISREKIRRAMDRNIENPEGQLSLGCDPADMGDDKTQMYVRKGWKTIIHRELTKRDGKEVALTIKSCVNSDPSIPCRIDSTGIGTSARDFARDMKLKTMPINFAQAAEDKDKYANIVTEMWFNLASIIDNIDIPDDSELMQELSGRKFEYDSKGRYKLESKDKFKKRIGRSPDKADALVLTYYQGGEIMISNEARKALRNRRR